MNTKQSVAQLAVPHRKRLSSTMVVALLLCVVAGAVMDMLLAKKRSEDRRNWLQEKGDMAEIEV